MGMAIFFSLSGFVIAMSYSHWPWRNRPVWCLVRLCLYRFARLYPAFLLFAVLVVMRTPRMRELLPTVEGQRYLAEHLLLWQSWLLVKYDGLLSPSSAFHVSWSLSTEAGLYLMFGLGAIIVGFLPSFRWKAVILTAIFFCGMGTLLAWLSDSRTLVAPDGWTEYEWYRWVYHISPLGVSLQFAVGAAAY